MVKKFDDSDIQGLIDIVKIGVVSSVSAERRTARVKIPESNTVSGDLKIIINNPKMQIVDFPNEIIINPWLPNIGDWVMCIFKPNGDGDGFILGGI